MSAPERVHPMPGQVLMHVENMGHDYDDDATPEVRTVVEDLDSAMVVTSQMVAQPWPDGSALHRPVLDIDLPATLVPSSTPGHSHLYIDQPMTWERYARLLEALADANLLQPGYVKAALRRGHTAVRVPWLRKDDPPPALLDPLTGSVSGVSDEYDVADLDEAPVVLEAVAPW